MKRSGAVLGMVTILCGCSQPTPEEVYAKYEAAKKECGLLEAKIFFRDNGRKENSANARFFKTECMKLRNAKVCRPMTEKLYPTSAGLKNNYVYAIEARRVCMTSRGF